MTNCSNKAHDHQLADNDEPGKCNDCGLPSHHDEGTGWYHHDDPDAVACFLTDPHSREGKTPCIIEPTEEKS